MDKIDTNKLTIDGGTYQIKFQTIFTDTAEPEYEHSIGWIVEPPLSRDKNHLEISGVVHKKYWKKLDIDPFSLKPDKSIFVDKYGWLSGPYNCSQFPEKARRILGKVLGHNISKNIGAIKSSNSNISLPSIPKDSNTEIYEWLCRVDAGYTVQSTDVRNNPTNHSFSWWFEPENTQKASQLLITKAYHKKWQTAINRDCEAKYPNESVNMCVSPSDSPQPFKTAPELIQSHLQDVFTEEIKSESES